MSEISKMRKPRTAIKSPGWKPGTTIQAEYGFTKLAGNSRPYFGVTASIATDRERLSGNWQAGGCCHEEIGAHFPEVAPLVRWHLCDDDGMPMHYVENALYWLEFVHGISEWEFDKYGQFAREGRTALDVFKSHAVWGALAEDTDEALRAYSDPLPGDNEATIGNRAALKARMVPMLVARLPGLKAAMRRDMDAHGVSYIAPEEYKAVRS